MPLRTIAQLNPKLACNEDGRVAAARKADEKRERKVLRRLSAEPIERECREQNREHRIERACQRLIDGGVDKLVHIPAAAEMQFQILTDAVKDDDGIVDRIPDNREQRRDKR